MKVKSVARKFLTGVLCVFLSVLLSFFSFGGNSFKAIAYADDSSTSRNSYEKYLDEYTLSILNTIQSKSVLNKTDEIDQMLADIPEAVSKIGNIFDDSESDETIQRGQEAREQTISLYEQLKANQDENFSADYDDYKYWASTFTNDLMNVFQKLDYGEDLAQCLNLSGFSALSRFSSIFRGYCFVSSLVFTALDLFNVFPKHDYVQEALDSFRDDVNVMHDELLDKINQIQEEGTQVDYWRNNFEGQISGVVDLTTIVNSANNLSLAYKSEGDHLVPNTVNINGNNILASDVDDSMISRMNLDEKIEFYKTQIYPSMKSINEAGALNIFASCYSSADYVINSDVDSKLNFFNNLVSSYLKKYMHSDVALKELQENTALFTGITAECITQTVSICEILKREAYLRTSILYDQLDKNPGGAIDSLNNQINQYTEKITAYEREHGFEGLWDELRGYSEKILDPDTDPTEKEDYISLREAGLEELIDNQVDADYILNIKERDKLINKVNDVRESVSLFYDAEACYRLWGNLKDYLWNTIDSPQSESPEYKPDVTSTNPCTITLDLGGQISYGDFVFLTQSCGWNAIYKENIIDSNSSSLLIGNVVLQKQCKYGDKLSDFTKDFSGIQPRLSGYEYKGLSSNYGYINDRVVKDNNYFIYGMYDISYNKQVNKYSYSSLSDGQTLSMMEALVEATKAYISRFVLVEPISVIIKDPKTGDFIKDKDGNNIGKWGFTNITDAFVALNGFAPFSYYDSTKDVKLLEGNDVTIRFNSDYVIDTTFNCLDGSVLKYKLTSDQKDKLYDSNNGTLKCDFSNLNSLTFDLNGHDVKRENSYKKNLFKFDLNNAEFRLVDSKYKKGQDLNEVSGIGVTTNKPCSISNVKFVYDGLDVHNKDNMHFDKSLMLNVDNCTFESCIGINGGAIENDANTSVINNCKFIGCIANNGGAIYLNERDFDEDIVNLCEYDNPCSFLPHAINEIKFGNQYVLNAIIDCTFDSCKAQANKSTNESSYCGGAICDQRSCTGIHGCKFNNNYAETDGGAYYVKFDLLNNVQPQDLSLETDSEFINQNNEDNYNDFWNTDFTIRRVYILDSTFESNEASNNGGAVYCGLTTDLFMVDSSLLCNQAVNGRGIFADSYEQIDITQGPFFEIRSSSNINLYGDIKTNRDDICLVSYCSSRTPLVSKICHNKKMKNSKYLNKPITSGPLMVSCIQKLFDASGSFEITDLLNFNDLPEQARKDPCSWIYSAKGKISARVDGETVKYYYE